MAIRGINMIEEFRWSSEHDDGEEVTEGTPNPENPKTYFWFGPIDATIRTTIMDNTLVYSQTDDGRAANTFRTGLRNIELVRYMLRRVENYFNPEGKAIPLELEDRFTNNKVYKTVPEHFISTLPPTVLNEIGDMLMRRINMSMEQKKNLPTP